MCPLPFPQPHSRNNNPLPVFPTIRPSSVLFQESESLYSELFWISSKTQLLTNSWASKPVIDPITMLLLFHPYFKCRTFSDWSSAQNGIFKDSAAVILFFSRQSRNPGRSTSYHLAAHSTQQYQFYHAREILWHCLLESSLAYSPALVLALSLSVSNFYLPS